VLATPDDPYARKSKKRRKDKSTSKVPAGDPVDRAKEQGQQDAALPAAAEQYAGVEMLIPLEADACKQLSCVMVELGSTYISLEVLEQTR
jgi:hypothetical protein